MTTAASPAATLLRLIAARGAGDIAGPAVDAKIAELTAAVTVTVTKTAAPRKAPARKLAVGVRVQVVAPGRPGDGQAATVWHRDRAGAVVQLDGAAHADAWFPTRDLVVLDGPRAIVQG